MRHLFARADPEMVAGVVSDLYAAAKRLHVDGTEPVPRNSGPRDQEEGFFARQERYIKQQGRKNRGKRLEEAGNARARAKRRMGPSPSADQLHQARRAGSWADAPGPEAESQEGPLEGAAAGGHGRVHAPPGNGHPLRGSDSPRASRAEEQYTPRSRYGTPRGVEPQAPRQGAPRRLAGPEARGRRANASLHSTPRGAAGRTAHGDGHRRAKAPGSGSESGSQPSASPAGQDKAPALIITGADMERVENEPDVRAREGRGE